MRTFVCVIPRSVQSVAALLQKLPGVGEKIALRYAFALAGADYTTPLSEALAALPFAVQPCDACNALIEGDCPFCARTSDTICVVHRFVDLLAIEKAANALRMRYFVLDKLLAPLEGIDEQDMPIAKLRAHVATAREIVLALPASVDGEATAMLLARHFEGLRVTQLARGLPHGGNLEHADPVTVRNAFDKRLPPGEAR